MKIQLWAAQPNKQCSAHSYLLASYALSLFVTLRIEVLPFSEAVVTFHYSTRRNIPDLIHQEHRLENLKFRIVNCT
jgi:hypothetical protein